MLKRGFVVAILTVIAATGCGEQVDVAAEEAAIRTADAEWLKAFEAKDAVRMASFYAEDASVFPPNAPIITGREAIRQMWTELVANPGFALSWESVSVEVARSGELAWVQETYEFSLQDPEGRLQEDRGKAVLIWKKQTDGGWKAIADIFNSDLPLSAPAEQGQ
jgi:uncharacterized protein (TIGR02246 family)